MMYGDREIKKYTLRSNGFMRKRERENIDRECLCAPRASHEASPGDADIKDRQTGSPTAPSWSPAACVLNGRFQTDVRRGYPPTKDCTQKDFVFLLL
ncbi:hypothetical protein EVAR_55921_1 [Eumeta japonica]|uniref:Uncharacterized protein n=1 Tax=Eumeta variegata TaxID=151549 RepID=A0A4C1YYT2_EUMVA|nr:hypothetical protein EVAR_55921_1 [Eumeta japonica]